MAGKLGTEVSSIEISVDTSGPLFDGKAEDALHQAKEAIEQRLAEMARAVARGHQIASIKVETTGAEPASLHVESSGFGRIVTDFHGIVYGPWLEGTGSRNETTRFKGYHAMRQTTSDINAVASSVANDEMSKYVDEMN